MNKNHNPIIITRRSIDEGLSSRTSAFFTDCADCACSSTQVSRHSVVPPEHIDSKKWVKNHPTHSQKLTNEYKVLYGPFHDIVVLNSVAEQLWEQFKGPTDLRQLKLETGYEDAIVRFINAGLIKPCSDPIRIVTDVPDTLSIWLHLTDRCNLRCQYCYLPHAKKDMSLKTGLSAIQAAFRSAVNHAYKRIRFKYSGGEALLNLPLILELHETANELGTLQGIDVYGVILSNGTLVNENVAELLVANKLQLAISLDGIGHIHNLQRSYASGKGSFWDVKRGIEIALAFGVQLNISVTVTTINATSLGPLVKWIRELNVPFSLNFYRENNLSSCLPLAGEVIIKGMLAAYSEIEKDIPRWSLLDSIVDRANLSEPHLRTCGVGSNYLVFDCEGRVSKCHMQIEKVVASSRVKDPLLNVHHETTGIINSSVENKEGCSTCNWKYWCAGGCPLMTFRATGKYNTMSPYCDIYKALYPAAMRLEGLRLLRFSVYNDPKNWTTC